MTRTEFSEMSARLDRARKFNSDCSALEQAIRDLRAGKWPYDVLRSLCGHGETSVAQADELNDFVEHALTGLLKKRQAALAEL